MVPSRVEPPIRTTSAAVIPPKGLPSPPPTTLGGHVPVSYVPPPPKGYSDLSNVTTPDLPPLPPLPPEAAAEENHPLMSSLDVSSLQSQAQAPAGPLHYPPMDNPRDVIGITSGRVPPRKESLYTITTLGGNGTTSSITAPASASPPLEAPPSEISV